ncbi:aspartate/glutamate racemase family protein [Nonomuraea sp. CA-141351]|uniref:aspartate/glutamate racemase family protein n=1 Tax=Nonomuraea sp. CA-141351 TaxID=3239996 RepID=UPI003D901533
MHTRVRPRRLRLDQGDDGGQPGPPLPRRGRTSSCARTTRCTRQPVYPAALGRRGITAEPPDASDRKLVNDIIFRELVKGVLTDESRETFRQVIQTLAERGCDAVALVCTEIPLLVTPESSPLARLDSTRLLARAALDVAIAREPMPSWRGGPFGQGSAGSSPSSRLSPTLTHRGPGCAGNCAPTLRAMEADGLLARTDPGSNPPHVEYALTELGRSPCWFRCVRCGSGPRLTCRTSSQPTNRPAPRMPTRWLIPRDGDQLFGCGHEARTLKIRL